MLSPRVECIEFYFVDPRLVDTNNQGVMLAVGAAIQGSYINEVQGRGTPDQMSQALCERIQYLVHSQQDMELLIGQSVGGTCQLYYCSLCGGNLNETECARCNTPHACPNRSFMTDPPYPTLPAQVSAYATSAAQHTFLKQPPQV